ncbi:MAG: nucleotidyl transferase AbiEii/AbiGii toxin family protein [Candidatus Cloacimonetes bacterium]|nr:nucleotidyl transferase AbiEii/AbiGii toxin family protein [Candidatus Cloacimonadota bacterium]
MKNIEASVRARLLTLAKQSKRDFNAILLQYFQERFLYRLSISESNENFVLKGALLFRIYKMTASRATTDIDFLGINIANSEKNIVSIFKSIVMISCDDGVRFDENSITSEIIKELDDYSGLRIYCLAYLGRTKRRIHFDIGFGDIIVPKPVILDFPVLLDNQPAPKITAYTAESAIAEKFEAIVSLGFYTSRMKDFYDVYYMSKNYSFTAQILKKAIKITFYSRSTNLSDQ